MSRPSMSRPLMSRPSMSRPPVVRGADLRLLLPAVAGWAAVAVLLGRDASLVLTVAASVGVLVVAAVAAFVVVRRVVPRIVPHIVRRTVTRTVIGTDIRLPGWAGLAVLTALAVVLCLVALGATTRVREAGPLRELADERAVVTVAGRLATDPRALDPPSGRPEGTAGSVVRLDVDRVEGRGMAASVRSPVLVIGDRTWLARHWQEEVVVTGRLAPAQDPADDVVAVLTPRGPPDVVADAGPVARAAEVVRLRFAEATDGLPTDARGLLPGLVIGDTSRTPRELDDAMLVTGMTHLSAVSGSNVAIVLGAAIGLAAAVGLRRRWRPVAAAVLLAGFVVLVRPEPSVVRAAAMGAVGLIGLAASRRRAGIPALAVAVLALLCWDPWLARSPGFALSTLATLGLLLFAASWGAAVGRWLPRRIQGWGTALAIPVAAQVMCAPVIVLLQGAVSVVGVAANLLAAPFVAPATILGVATALVSVVSTTVASWLAWGAALPTLAIAWIARTGAEAPLATVPWPSSGVGAGTLALLSLGLVLGGPWLMHQAVRRPLLPVGAVVLAVGVAVPTHTVTWPMTSWGFVACDVGQGDGMVLSTGPGRAVVVDVGPDPALVDGCLDRLHVGLVDAVILTHFHADHVDGLPGVLRGRTVRQILVSPVREPQLQAEEVHDWAMAAGVPVSEVYAGDHLAWPGMTADVWWPARVIHEGSVPNNASVVLTVAVAGLRLLLLGDIEREAARAVLLELRQDHDLRGGARAPPEFDVVKVAHHGSANRDDALLELARAPVAVVSVGADNDYGHPAASTLATLARDGYRVYRTDESGDIAVRRADEGAVEVATLR